MLFPLSLLLLCLDFGVMYIWHSSADLLAWGTSDSIFGIMLCLVFLVSFEFLTSVKSLRLNYSERKNRTSIFPLYLKQIVLIYGTYGGVIFSESTRLNAFLLILGFLAFFRSRKEVSKQFLKQYSYIKVISSYNFPP